jgi:hypothetical protein
MRLHPLGHAASPAAVACKNAAGGSATRARPMASIGTVCWTTSSP